MKITVRADGVRIESWDNTAKGKGKGSVHLLSCSDVDRDNRLINSFDYRLTEDEAAKPPAVDAVIDLGIISLESGFGGRVRMTGKILPTSRKV